MPAHCKVNGVMHERTGADGKPYAIGFEMRLPVDWNGRFLFQTNGGNDGVVSPAFGNVVVSGATTNALMQGFAVLSSDAGHRMLPPAEAGLVGGNLFGLDPRARLDYGYMANGALAPMAWQLIATHYRQGPKTSYMMGCSNGGRHAMVAASRYAGQFDGIIAGDPGFNLPKATVQHAWDIQAFSAANPDIKASFAPQYMKLVADKVLEKCDALDGLADGIVNKFRESAMQFMTPPGADGLRAFRARGGKMMVYHGTSDPVFSFNDTRNWYNSLNRNHQYNADSFVRLFPVPGMNHCQGGPTTEQFDMSSAIVNWVEKGQAPAQVIATARTGLNPDVPADWVSNGKPRSRPLCPYPQQARYKGMGDVNDAANFSCQ